MLLPIHIAAGGLAIVLGAVALSAKKGGTIHCRSGLLFVYAMLVMGSTGAILGLRSGATGNVFGGVGTAYFVVTALTTVRPASPWTRGINVAGLTVAVGLALLHIVAGLQAFNSPTGWRNGAPFQMLFFLATIMMLAAIGDVRNRRCTCSMRLPCSVCFSSRELRAGPNRVGRALATCGGRGPSTANRTSCQTGARSAARASAHS